VSYDSRPETIEHIEAVRSLADLFIRKLRRRAEGHDASKLEDPELSMFNEYTPRLRALTYGSEEYKRCLEEMGEALRHHYDHNRHHPEHFEAGVRDMTLVDLVEMFLDWAAAARRHGDGDLSESIEINADRFGLSADLQAILTNTVPLVEEGPTSAP
jgi:hypothetical protein